MTVPTTDPDSKPWWAYWRTALWLMIALAPVVVFGIMIWQRRWTSDDGFINMRVAHNLLAGHGPVFNVGERVETYTSTLWLGILALAGALGARIESAGASLGLALSVIGAWATIWGATILHKWDGDRGPDAFRAVLPLGMITYVALAPSWDYGTAGLETGLSLGWLGLCFLLLVRLARAKFTGPDSPARPGWHGYGIAFVLGLGPLIRPDMALFSIGFLLPLLACVVRQEDGGFDLKKLVLVGLAMGAVPIIYQIFRMGYFAALVPNTALAKEAFHSRWDQGWLYFDNFFGLYQLGWPLSLLAIVWLEKLVRISRRDQWVRLSLLVIPVLCGAAHCLYIVKLGGGFMHGRLFLPGVFGMLMPLAALDLWGAKRSPIIVGERIIVALVVCGWALYVGTEVRVARENEHGIGDERGWYVRLSEVAHPVRFEDYRHMYFYEDAKRLRDIAKKRCPAAFVGQTGSVASADGQCAPFVYASRLQGVDHGRFFPHQTRAPLEQSYAERGLAFVVMRTAIGMRSLVLGPATHVVDHVGLASPLASRLELTQRGRPGHEKKLSSTWLMARFAQPRAVEDPRIGAARRALQCGELAELLEAVVGPISVGRFMSNLTGAFAFHDLRVPTDPWQAEQTFCKRQPPTQQVGGGTGGQRHQWRCPPGHALGGLSLAEHPEGMALVSIKPLCKPIRSRDQQIVLGSATAPAPRFGGKSAVRAQTLNCPENTALKGLRGGASKFVEHLGLLCAMPPAEHAPHADSSATQQVGSGGQPFELSCPNAQIATGLVVRSGVLIDAVGLQCRPADQLDQTAPSSQ